MSALLILLPALCFQAAAARGPTAIRELAGAANVVIPQSRCYNLAGKSSAIRIESVTARVRIVEQVATTTLDLDLRNTTQNREGAVLILPVPDASAVTGFALAGSRDGGSAKVMKRDEARALYERIVSNVRDPGLLEFHGRSLIRSSVFPLAPGATQRVRLTYEQLLAADGDRFDYVLPRSDSLAQLAPWDVSVEILTKRPVSLVYSPSHDITKKRRKRTLVSVRLKPKSRTEPGAFRLSWLVERGSEVTASLIAYPETAGDSGYFLLLAGLPSFDAEDLALVKREVTLVLDRSGSMAGPKMRQARRAAIRIIESLRDGETFNVIDYSTAVASCFETPQPKSPATVAEASRYCAELVPGGGTNIHDALEEALKPLPAAGALPIVLFLTDGLPTVGRTREIVIRDLVENKNPHGRRVFTFGVGEDVNVPLLDRIAEASRALSTYVLPTDNVDTRVNAAFRKLWGPVLAAPQLVALDAKGEVWKDRVQLPYPERLPDLFENDRIVLLGRYRGSEPLRLRLDGAWLGKPRRFEFTFQLDRATVRNGFVPRLWASRRIAHLVDRVRQRGAAAASLPQVRGRPQWTDPRLNELRDEILRLSTKFGVLSEYTSFLASEGIKLTAWKDLIFACQNNLAGRAIRTRSGRGALSQGRNIRAQKQQTFLNPRNEWLDENLKTVETTAVQQVGDWAFFKRGSRWIDSRIVLNGKFEPDETVEFGSPAHTELLEQLTKDGRQGALSLRGEILIWTPDRTYLVKGRH